ncbi:hypothetical protein Hokovirus_4_42 [Hokovirus HKV1]|uniref:Uncharacterized protein n=1 Tax=Hokovirus HKV1 TaxID=1977638 RepID=A0A1V0SHF1_9VIRU|nr:hypothetical protein Hokovirus_4_42 [Hokovirus HKV1]
MKKTNYVKKTVNLIEQDTEIIKNIDKEDIRDTKKKIIKKKPVDDISNNSDTMRDKINYIYDILNEIKNTFKFKKDINEDSNIIEKIERPKKTLRDVLVNPDDYVTLDKFKKFTETLLYAPPIEKSVNYKNIWLTDMKLDRIALFLSRLQVFNVCSISSKINNSVPLSLILYTGNPETKNLHSFLVRLENEILKYMRNNISKKINIKSSILKYPDYKYPIFKVSAPFTRKSSSIVEYPFHVLTMDGNRTHFSEIQRRSTVSCFIELDYIWFNDKDFGIEWTLKQVKVYPILLWNVNHFTDNDVEEVKPIECYHCMYCPNHHIRTCDIINNIPPPPPPPPLLPKINTIKTEITKPKNDTKTNDKKWITVTDEILLNSKALLKPVLKKNENIEDKKNEEVIKNVFDNLL